MFAISSPDEFLVNYVLQVFTYLHNSLQVLFNLPSFQALRVLVRSQVPPNLTVLNHRQRDHPPGTVKFRHFVALLPMLHWPRHAHITVSATTTLSFSIYLITSAKQSCFCHCLSVSNFVQKLPNGFAWKLANEQMIKFWWRSGSPSVYRDLLFSRFVTIGRYRKWYQPTALRDAAVHGMH